jgi:Helix-turn-helix domain/Domain of unknown function (DUF4115)
MSIGETLAQARRWAGLSVTEVSQRTRIRETLVKDIERDDYSACGGDFYTRGHIRAIARVVGADPEALIEEYDAIHQAPNEQLADTVPQPVTPVRTRGWPDPPTRPADDVFPNVRPVGTSGWPQREPPTSPPDDGSPDVRPAGSSGWPQREEEPAGPADDLSQDVRPAGSRGWPQREPPTRPADDASQQVRLIGTGSWQQEPPSAPAADPPPARVTGRPQQAPPVRPDTDVQYRYGPGAPRGRQQRNWPVLFGLVLLVVLGFLGYYFVSGSGKSSTGTPAAGNSPAGGGATPSSQAGGTAANPAHAVIVHLTAVRPVSVVFTTPSGKTLFRSTIAAGASKKWMFRHAVTMRLANPGGAKLVVNGKNPLPHGSAVPVTLTLTPGHPAVVANPASTPTPAGTPTPAVPLTDSVLAPASATSFGTSGPGQGDNQQLASMAIDGSRRTAWDTDWYTNPRFGNLYPGTGLLLDMGKSVTITGAQISLGNAPGASFQLRVGSAPRLADLTPAAHAAGASGVVRVQLTTPLHGRYVLIWFTRLPLNANGNYEASVHDVRLEGRT